MARKRMAWLIVLGCLLAAGCGTAATRSTTSRSVGAPSRAADGIPPEFAWLRPGPPPPSWTLARLSAGTTLPVPPGWRRLRADTGTASAARVDAGSGLVAEYLNATPQQGGETLQNWSRFRPEHNLDEGDRHEQVLAAAQGLRFRSGSGSCVIDRYRTSRAGYQEIACLVRGARGESVVVAAALTAHWAQAAPVLERAVSSFVP